jgi:hypothetical protein
MKPRLLLVVPVILAAALWLMGHLLAGSPSLGLALHVQVEVLKTLAVIGCFAAAWSFERGDYLWRAWFLNGLCYAILVVRDVALGAWTPWAPGPHILGMPTEGIESVVVFIANVIGIWGTLLLARAWQVAGLGEADSATRRRALFIVALLVALVVIGASARSEIESLGKGNLNALVILASDLGDIISLALVAPVLSTALALRGGLLIWPWALLTAGGFAWLGYDATTSVGQVVRGSESLKMTGEIFRSLGCSLTLVAGLAQRMVLKRD